MGRGVGPEVWSGWQPFCNDPPCLKPLHVAAQSQLQLLHGSHAHAYSLERMALWSLCFFTQGGRLLDCFIHSFNSNLLGFY